MESKTFNTGFTPDMLMWINEGNVIKLGENKYIEQSTQWKRIFSKIDLINFYCKEFGN